ncbi:MAG TPA: peptide deformylase [Actinomycetota bacterium]|nr:peptide deformylase [Actinomycetota bacterium]
MALRDIVLYPAPVLKRRAEPVSEITDLVTQLIEDLLDTMRASPATIGLAAPQIGVPSRCFVMDLTGHPKVPSPHGPIALVDPQVEGSEGHGIAREGCLSVPDLTANVERADALILSGLDPGGRERTLELQGFEARVALHELDHLEGTLILDRATSPSDLFARKVYR